MNARPGTLLPALKAGSCVAMTGAMYGAARLRMRVANEKDRAAIWDRRFQVWARRTSGLLGVRPRFVGSPPEPTTGPRMVVANHRTAADIPLLFGMFGGRILSRADVAQWPLVGHLAAQAGTLFVDRSDGSSGAAAIRMIRRALRDGNTVILFPEGGTFPGDEVRPFFAGAFAAARGTGASVTCVGFAYPEGLEWWKQTPLDHFRVLTAAPRIPVGIAVGSPRALAGKADAEAERLRDEVQALVQTARSRLREG